MRNCFCLVVVQLLFLSLCVAVPTNAQSQEFQEVLAAVKSNLAGALGNLEGFVASHPKDAIARFELAKAYMNNKNGEAAEEQLRVCMELAPVGTELHNNCIESLRQISEGRVGNLKNTVPSNQRSIAPRTNNDTTSVSRSAASTTWTRPRATSPATVTPATVKSVVNTAASKSAPVKK